MSEFWKLLAGVAIFMLGMSLLEEALHALSGRKFKLFLRKQTANPITAIGGGALVTAILQSSSVVNLIVLALVGAGTVPMLNALAVVLGSNLGTTLTSWVVATVGFKFSIDQLALPVIAITGISRILTKRDSTLYKWVSLFLGIGFLFFGLEMMKTGMQEVITAFDLSSLVHYPLIIYLIVGVIITSLIQSSSATVAIVLSALYAGAIELPAAMSIVLGSEIGTTIKLLIASVGKQSAMKRLALGNFIFNLVSALIVFIILYPVHHFITSIVHIKDTLVSLAFFQTFLNLFSIILFYPFLGLLAKLLQRMYKNEYRETKYIAASPVEDIDLALNALESETSHFLKSVIYYTAGALETNNITQIRPALSEQFLEKGPSEKYEFIKHLHGDIYAYYIALQNMSANTEQAQKMEQLIGAVRNGMYAAKNIKDARPDLIQLENSGNDTKYKLYLEARQKFGGLLDTIAQLLQSSGKESYFEDLTSLYQAIQTSYTNTLNELYEHDHSTKLSEVEISTVINFNREMYSAFKSLVFGVKDLLLNKNEAKYFDELPGFIR